MNPASEAAGRARSGACLPYILLFLWFCAISTLGVLTRVCSDFTERYYVPGGNVHDWNAPLMWKLLQFYDWLEPGDYDAVLAGRVWGVIWALILLAACALVVRTLMKRHYSPYPFIFVLFAVVNPFCFDILNIRIDMAVTAFLALTLAVIYALSAFRSKWKWALILTLVFVTVLHRTNALVMVPALCAYGISSGMSRVAHRKLILLVSSLGLSMALFAGVYLFHYEVLGALRTRPEIVMIQSDVFCMDALKGKTPCGEVSKRLECGRIGPAEGVCSGRDTDDLIMARWPLTYRENPPARHQNVYATWRDVWTEQVLQDPMAFLTVRTVLTFQFFSQGTCPEFLIKRIRESYPNARLSSERTPYSDHINLPHKLSLVLNLPPYLGYLCRDVVVVTYLLSFILLPCVYVRQRADFAGSALLRLSLGAFSASVFYTLSFIPFIPTPDCRFLSPALLAWAISLGALWTYWLEERRPRRLPVELRA